MTRVKLNVSGVVFEFEHKLLKGFQDHTLYGLCFNGARTDGTIHLAVDRPSDCFAAILSYYETGELHLPNNVCPNAFRTELLYWRVPESQLQRCCYYK